MTPTPLGADEDNGFEFDLTVDPIAYEGFASTPGPEVDFTISCPGEDPIVTTTKAGGAWFVAPSDEYYSADGPSLTGFYSDGAALPVTVEWTLTRVE